MYSKRAVNGQMMPIELMMNVDEATCGMSCEDLVGWYEVLAFSRVDAQIWNRLRRKIMGQSANTDSPQKWLLNCVCICVCFSIKLITSVHPPRRLFNQLCHVFVCLSISRIT